MQKISKYTCIEYSGRESNWVNDQFWILKLQTFSILALFWRMSYASIQIVTQKKVFCFWEIRSNFYQLMTYMWSHSFQKLYGMEVEARDNVDGSLFHTFQLSFWTYMKRTAFLTIPYPFVSARRYWYNNIWMMYMLRIFWRCHKPIVS